MNVNLAGQWGGWFVLIWAGLALATVIVHVLFASAVLIDSTRTYRQRGCTVFVDPILWTVATLLGGPVVACFYWVLHHSSLRTGDAESNGPSTNWVRGPRPPQP